MSIVFASDIDHTLIGGPVDHVIRLNKKLAQLQNQNKLFLILSTGRRIDEVISGFTEEYIPVPDAVITQVGTEIFLPPFSADEKPLEDWDKLLKSEYKRSEAEEFVKDIPGLEMQPEKYNTALKLSVYLDNTPDPEAAAKKVIDRVAKSNSKGYRVVWSSGRDLDIIPKSSGKANAIKHVIKIQNLQPEKVIVAGDSGNDRVMFEEFPYGIMVANAKPELVEFLKSSSASPHHYLAKKPCAEGVEEGLKHFEVF
jgi:sucrose-6F-phosphate phosphohydrolase